MRRTVGIAGVAILFGGAFALGLLLTRAHAGGPQRTGLPEGPTHLLDEVRRELTSGYYRAVPDSVLASDSVDELIAGLRDPYTDYLTTTEYAALRNRTARSYTGIGLTVRPARDGFIVKGALRGPARAAGVRPGDRIVSIDGRRVRTLPLARSLELGGREGTAVRLTIRRPRDGMMNVTVRRKEIELPALRSRLLRAGGEPVGYVRVLSFRANAAETLTERAKGLMRAGAKGLVLDLRDNPGGLLSQAVRTVSVFVDRGVVCVTEGAHHGRRSYEVSGKAALPRVPLVVVVDNGSASAAEVVAAALEEHRRAVLVGGATYGKASVQSVRELSDGTALKMTTAVFRTPSGAHLTARGLRPSVTAADNPRTRRDEALAKATEVLVKQLR